MFDNDVSEVDEQLKKGGTDLYNMKIKESNDYFSGLKSGLSKREKHRATRYSFHIAEGLTLRALVTEEQQHVDEAFSSLKAAERIAEQNCQCPGGKMVKSVMGLFKKRHVIEEMPEHWSTDTCIVFAQVHLFTACLMFRTGAYVKGGARLRRAWKMFQRVGEIMNETSEQLEYSLGDLYLGLGIFHFALSLIPSGFRWIVEAIGFEVDRDLGVKELHKARDIPGPAQAKAHLMLLWIESVFYEKLESAEEVYQEIADIYPQGSLYHYLGGYIARKRGLMDDAETRFQLSFDCSEQIPQLQLMSIYELGWCAFVRCQYDKAIEYLEEFLSKYHSPSFRAYAGWQLGTSYAMLGKNEDATRVMKMVPDFVRKHYSYDVYAGRKAHEFLESGTLSDFDRFVMNASNHLDRLDSEACSESLRKARDCFSDGNRDFKQEEIEREEFVQIYYLNGRLHRLNGNLRDAKIELGKVVEVEGFVKHESYIVPFSLCEIGEILVDEGELKEAELYFKKVKKNYSGFDFDKPLARRILLNMDVVREMEIKNKN